VDVGFEMGASFPAHATAIGKMLLAQLPDADLFELLDSEQLVKRSPRTINSKADLIRNLEDIRRRGHSTSNGELFMRIRGLAVPIVDSAGQTCAGLTVAGPRLRLDDDGAIRAIHDGAGDGRPQAVVAFTVRSAHRITACRSGSARIGLSLQKVVGRIAFPSL